MTNKDYFLKDNVSVEKFITAFIKKENISINSLEVDQINHFLKSEFTPTLTEDERVILRNIEEDLRYIGREDDEIYLAWKKGEGKQYHFDFSAYDHLFQFIKERRRIRDS